MDLNADLSHHGLCMLGKPLCLRLQLDNNTSAAAGIFSLTKIPWNQTQDPEHEQEDDDGMCMDWESPPRDDSKSMVATTPTIMNSETRTVVHVRFLSLVIFRYVFWINCQATDDILLDPSTGHIYSLREREMTGGKPPQWEKLLPMEWSRHAWEEYLKKKIFEQNPLILDILKQRCLRWKKILQVPAIVQAVFDPLHINVENYSQKLQDLSMDGVNKWMEIGTFC